MRECPHPGVKFFIEGDLRPGSKASNSFHTQRTFGYFK